MKEEINMLRDGFRSEFSNVIAIVNGLGDSSKSTGSISSVDRNESKEDKHKEIASKFADL